MIKSIETEYKGYRFRSRLEARWAVFFDVCGVRWEYEPEGFDLGDGLYYLPDFLLHDVWIRNNYKRDLWAEVKGKMTEIDAVKIDRFCWGRYATEEEMAEGHIMFIDNPIIVLGNILDGDEWWDLFNSIYDNQNAVNWFGADCFNFYFIDGDYYNALPCVSPEGHFAIVGGDYLEDIDSETTVKAYNIARQARFEHGESPNTFVRNCFR